MLYEEGGMVGHLNAPLVNRWCCEAGERSPPLARGCSSLHSQLKGVIRKAMQWAGWFGGGKRDESGGVLRHFQGGTRSRGRA